MIRPDETAVSDIAVSKKDFFTTKVNHSYKKLIDYAISELGYLPDFIKYSLALDIQEYYDVPSSTVLTKSEYNEFRKSLQDVLAYIDDEIILNHKFLGENIKSFLIYLKNNEFHIDVEANRVSLK